MPKYGSLRRHAWALPIEGVMVVGAITMVVDGDWFHLATCLFTTAVSFAPLWVERLLRIYIPSWVQLLYVLFVFASMFCGEVWRFYSLVAGWDEAMHGISGVLVGFSVVLWLRWLIRSNRLVMAPWLQVVFIVAFNCLVAISWETVEFLSDQMFGTSSQDKSLFDTMTDLIYGTLGGVLLAFLYKRVLAGKKVYGLSTGVASFERHNR